MIAKLRIAAKGLEVAKKTSSRRRPELLFFVPGVFAPVLCRRCNQRQIATQERPSACAIKFSLDDFAVVSVVKDTDAVKVSDNLVARPALRVPTGLKAENAE